MAPLYRPDHVGRVDLKERAPSLLLGPPLPFLPSGLLPQQRCSHHAVRLPVAGAGLPLQCCASWAQLCSRPLPHLHSPPVRPRARPPPPRWEDTGSEMLRACPWDQLAGAGQGVSPPGVTQGLAGPPARLSEGVAPSCCLRLCIPDPDSIRLRSTCQMSEFTSPPSP